ncbi:GGDEF domain-containing protein [Yoonia litorea]|uniref:diguanylate cyclase n=1 Tax=Yoonia litorea TaxID=1123755 RepID=A0A1I6MTQ5_9RHOB|nr:diguanylate cyclase [Yoonia litorea]SFS19082.1 diguanylate cyclase [Yoonia litorea]
MQFLQILLAPALAVMGIAFIYNLLLQRFADSRFRDAAFGLMFGGAIVLGMANPISLGDGVIFDSRSLILGAAVAFCSYRAGAIALGISLCSRIVIGGAGVVSGVVGLILAFGLAVAWVHWAFPKIKNPFIADASLAIAISPTLLAVFLLPWDLAISILQTVGPVITLCNLVGMVVLGFVFRREIRQFNRRSDLLREATTDPLTNLLNRRGFDRSVHHAARPHQTGRALLYFDIDNFKHINDTLGHDTGDLVLGLIAKRIGESLREDAKFARQGGDEFSIYLPDIDETDVRSVADRLCRIINQAPFQIDGKQVDVSISMGAFWAEEDLSLDHMIKAADEQLLLAKQAGKNRAQIRFARTTNLAAHA